MVNFKLKNIFLKDKTKKYSVKKKSPLLVR